MSQPELMQIAESLTGLIPRLARGLSSPGNPAARGTIRPTICRWRSFGCAASSARAARAMSALSRELGVSLRALTQIANRLERARLVKRTAAEDDRRVRCLQLTAHGTAMMRRRRDARLRRSLAVLDIFRPPSGNSCERRWRRSSPPAPRAKAA